MDEQKLIHDPSQKVLAMYQAVIEFINEIGRASCRERV